MRDKPEREDGIQLERRIEVKGGKKPEGGVVKSGENGSSEEIVSSLETTPI